MKNDRKYGAIIKQAHEAGMIAGEGITPVPMVIGTPTALFGSEIDYTKPVEVISAGACGFAYVHIAGIHRSVGGRWPRPSWRRSDRRHADCSASRNTMVV